MKGLQKSLLIGYVLAISGGIFWAVGGSCGQYLFEHYGISSDWLVPIRLNCSGILLLLIGLVRKQKLFEIWHDKRDIFDLIIFGLFGSALCQFAFYSTIEYANVALATVLAYMSPSLILVYTVIKEKRAPKLYEIICVSLVLAGAYTCTTHWNLNALAITPKALFWGILSAMTFALYTVQPLRLLSKYDLPVVIGWGMVVGGVAQDILFQPWNVSIKTDPVFFLNLFVVIIFGTVLAFFCYQFGITMVGSITGSILSSVEPIASMIISVLFLNVALVGLDYLGFIMILSSIPIIALGNLKKAKTMKKA